VVVVVFAPGIANSEAWKVFFSSKEGKPFEKIPADLFPEGRMHPSELRRLVWSKAESKARVAFFTRSDYIVRAASDLVRLGEMQEDDRDRFLQKQNASGFRRGTELRAAEVRAFSVSVEQGEITVTPLVVDGDGFTARHLDDEIELSSGLAQDISFFE